MDENGANEEMKFRTSLIVRGNWSARKDRGRLYTSMLIFTV